MTDYSTKRALVDIGFVCGYFWVSDSDIQDDAMFESLMDAFNRIQEVAVKGSLLEASPTEANYRQLLFDLGYVRGWAWMKAIPDEISIAIRRLIDYFSESLPITEIIFAHPKKIEPAEERVSDDDRDFANAAYEGYPSIEGIAGAIGKPEKTVERILADKRDVKREENLILVEAAIESASPSKPDASIIDSPIAQKSASRPMGHREWTPEQRAIRAEGARKRRKPPFDEDFDDVKTVFDAGNSLLAIGRKYGCSEAHIRNFLTKHGIDPRRTVVGTHKGRPPLSDDEIQLIITEKAKGTPSKDIGEMIDRSQHAIDQKYSDLKKAGLVPDEHLTSEAIEERQKAANALRAESMRAVHAQKRNGHGIEHVLEPRDEIPPHRLTVAHPEYIGKRDPDQDLTEADWPDIQNMLEKMRRSVSQIASDYDVEFATMRQFIDRHMWNGKPAPGEASAPSR